MFQVSPSRSLVPKNYDGNKGGSSYTGGKCCRRKVLGFNSELILRTNFLKQHCETYFRCPVSKALVKASNIVY